MPDDRSKKIECPLENLTVYTWPAPMDFSQSLIAQRALSDKHRQLLSRLQPLQITPLRKQGMKTRSGACRCH